MIGHYKPVNLHIDTVSIFAICSFLLFTAAMISCDLDLKCLWILANITVLHLKNVLHAVHLLCL